ncbi:MAG: CRISPR-associated endoribonuclease Cas6 [Atribacterota bacterium]
MTLEKRDSLITLPISYNYYVQSMIYHNISDKLADELHKKGFPFEKRKFRMFVFSRIQGRYKTNKNDKKIIFESPISIIFSTPYNVLTQSLAEKIMKEGDIRIGGNELFINSIQVYKNKMFDSTLKIKILSPVTVYSTLYKNNDEGKKTYYYNPYEEEFNELIHDNIIKKYIAFYEKEPEDKNFNIEPFKVSQRRNHVVSFYKGTVIKGWTGIYQLTGSPELIDFSYDAGLGSKNSQGFGMWEVVNKG